MSTVCAAGLFMSVAASLTAQVMTFEADWSSPATGATAVATFDLDLAVFNMVSNGFPGNGVQTFASLGVSNFTITVTGASSGNGTWTDAGLQGMVMYAVVPIDPTVEWVGQSQGDYGTWGTYDGGGFHDFNVFGVGGATPNGTWYYELTPNHGTAEHLYLTSVHPVPVPAATAAFGLGGLAALRRRRR